MLLYFTIAIRPAGTEPLPETSGFFRLLKNTDQPEITASPSTGHDLSHFRWHIRDDPSETRLPGREEAAHVRQLMTFARQSVASPGRMRFLLHGNLDPSVKIAVERHGHKASSATEAELDVGSDAAGLLNAAHQKQFDILTNDREFAHFARTTSLKFDRSIIYLQLEGEAVEQDDAVDRLFARYKAPKPRQLYTVTETRVKVQQLKSA